MHCLLFTEEMNTKNFVAVTSWEALSAMLNLKPPNFTKEQFLAGLLWQYSITRLLERCFLQTVPAFEFLFDHLLAM